MNRIVTPIVLFLLNTTLFAGANQEFRATWVITWEHISSGSSAETNMERVRTILDHHKKGNFNAVLWQVRQGGTAYYNSSFEPYGYYSGYQYPGYDPLAYAIQEAHARGLEVHAWFNVFQTSSTEPGTPVSNHPDWVCRDSQGNPMTSSIAVSPGMKAVRDYTVGVAMEIVRKYDIDGLHLDYVRWNEYSSALSQQILGKLTPEERQLDGMISDEQIEILENNQGSRYLWDVEHPYSAGVPTGFASWEDWWRWSVTEFVRTLHDSIQAVKPWVRLSAAALGKYNWSGWQGYGVVYQDAALWFNEGYIDQLTPMHYHWSTGADFYGMLTGDCPACWGQFLQPGIQDGRMFSVGPGSYILLENKTWYRHKEIVEYSRTIPWVDGFQFFSYGSWRDYRYWDEAASSIFKRKTKIRAPGLVETTPPAQPGIDLKKLDSLAYEIKVTPATSEKDNGWFAVYRSEDAVIDPASDEIIDIHFGNSPYSIRDQFSGNQDFNNRYHYAATALDRYWNESGASNAVQSDLIPSLAPVVVSSQPAVGDTVPVNTAIVIRFSKTMDLASTNAAVAFNPAVALKQIIWSEDQKTMTLVPSQNLTFATAYTLTIQSTATDVNGKFLDGNGDGNGGDPFTVPFQTQAQDNQGPRIVTSNPDWQAFIDNFDVTDVITFLFDEVLESGTVTNSSIGLTQAGNPVEFRFNLTNVDFKSVLSIQPRKPFQVNSEYSLSLAETIQDTAGNAMGTGVQVNFKTNSSEYTEIKAIDDFSVPGEWQQPSYSGSTTGIVVTESEFGFDRQVALPGPNFKRSAFLKYKWDVTASSFLVREYLSGGLPRDVVFDTSYVLQCYVFGDGSYNQFRFCIDEAQGSTWPNHEVSQWLTLDWYGWRLVEWDLSNPNSVGTWIGNGILDGTGYRIDSFQLTHQQGAAISGKIYLDDLRLVKKTIVSGVFEPDLGVPRAFELLQNYPNPFNPTTTIPYYLVRSGPVELKIFNLLGEEITTLIDEVQNAGYHEVFFDASELASGVYYYRLATNSMVLNKKMLLIK